MYRWRLALLALVAALLIASLAWAQAEPPATNDPAPAADEMPAAQDEAVAEQPAAVEPAAAEPVVPVVEEHPAAVVTEHAAAEHEAAGGHGEGEKKEEEHWTLFGYIPVGWTIPIAQTVAGWFGWHVDPHQFTAHGLLHVEIMLFVLILITIFSVVVGGKYKRMLNEDPAPRPGISGANLMEFIVNFVDGMMGEIIGGHNPQKYLPLIGGLTFVILFNNLLGLIPGFYTATDNWNTTLALALVVFVLYHYYGVKTHGVLKYLDHFLGPLEGKTKWIMAPLMFPIELISHFARPMSLSLRLFGNMFGDHKVFAVFMGLVAVPLVYPLPFLALGLLVAIVQTLVFIMLTMVYIGLATAQEH
ncbi:MAG TPA: F0F1 ATP synthase subunit A [bacterium]|nr:F0F1 ATP synthase subunit A [bacterium]